MAKPSIQSEPPFPRKIRVGFRTYAVEDWAPKAASAANRYGEASHVERVLRLDRSHGAVQAVETMLHELLHAVAATGHDELFASEERAVTGLSAGMTQVMRDNPDLRSWMMWAWAEDD